MRRTFAALFALLSLPSIALAQESTLDAAGWLQRMDQAARTQNYTGVFVYRAGGRVETSRVTHYVDASGEYEKLETLDGPSREVVRSRGEVRSYLPGSRTVVIDRVESRRFPGPLVPFLSGAISEHYVLKLGGVGRVAGRAAQQVFVVPRDDLRYGHQFWADIQSGLLLKARMLDGQSDTLEQFGFSEITLDPPLDRQKVRSQFEQAAGWRIINARGGDVRVEDSGWVFDGIPPGFRIVSAAKRQLHGDATEAYHFVYSDGLASISVFIETAAARGATPPPAVNGSIGIVKRMVANQMITVLGEVPLPALQRVANSAAERR